jgi:hypothetical protein
LEPVCFRCWSFRQSPLASAGVLPHLLTQSLVPGYDVARTDGSLPAAHCVGASRLELLTPSL